MPVGGERFFVKKSLWGKNLDGIKKPDSCEPNHCHRGQLVISGIKKDPAID
jgi:hypothetical protein